MKTAVPDLHVHAFSPLELSHGAQTLGVSLRTLLARLRDAGLGSLPGAAAEILDDGVRGQICPDKLSTREWLNVVGTAHEVRLKTTSTIMIGHVETLIHWAQRPLATREQQFRTGGFTEFVPLSFVLMQTPIYLRGAACRGPTWRECLLMHAVARIAQHGAIDSIQASWAKLGLDGAAAALRAGVNDLGGVLMNDSISPRRGRVGRSATGLARHGLRTASPAAAARRPRRSSGLRIASPRVSARNRSARRLVESRRFRSESRDRPLIRR